MAAPSDEQIMALNPWWRDPAAIERDPKIRALQQRSYLWEPPVLDAIEIGPARIHTLRGPRQAGKSTTAKLLIRRLLEAGERRILFFSFDLSTDRADIVRVAQLARRIHPSPEGPWFVFFDEITMVPDWQLGVKYIVDNGPAEEDFILCTGSSARRVGSERLPGRRGHGRHYVQLPASFRDFCIHARGIDLPPETISAADALTHEGMRSVRAVNLARADLEPAWTQYRETGGFPAAIEDLLNAGRVRDETVEMIWDIVAGDVREFGRDDVAAAKLLERVSRSLGSPLSWHSLSEDMDVSQPTARKYVELLAESFLLLTVFAWETSGKGLNPRKQRKIYFADPLLGRIGPSIIPGSPSPNEASVREAIVANALFRSATDRLVQAAPLPGSLCFWKSGRGREIDFLVADSGGAGAVNRLPIEVKGDSAAAITNARASIGRAFGRGLIVTERIFEPDHRIPAIPAPILLAALKERPERRRVAA